MDEKFVEVDEFNSVDDGTGQAKLGDDGQPVPYQEQNVPYSRFKEVNDSVKTLQDEIKALKETGKAQDGGLTADQKKELEAKQYLEKLTREQIEKVQAEMSQKEKDELDAFNKEVTDLLSAHKDVKRDEFISFLEKEGGDYSTVPAAMRGYLRLQETAKKSADDTRRSMGSKPRMPGSEGTGGEGAQAADSDKNKSLWEIAAEAISQIKK